MNAPASIDAIGFQLKESVAELSTLILSKHPKMPVLLRTIHTTISKYPEQVTLLSEEEIKSICDGLFAQTGVEFAASALKSTPSKTAALKNKIATLGADAF